MKSCSFSPADILLPKNNFEDWAVIACDQYTSEPEYWQKVKKIVGENNSALNIILPEVYLNEDNREAIEGINKNMQNYIDSKIFDCYENSCFYIERTQSDGRVRKGIVGKIDLECYDFTKKSTAEIRATEETVLERIPPRVKIRENAPLETPHVMLLIDDKNKDIIEPLELKKQDFKKVYDFKLMQNGGHIRGWQLSTAETEVLLEKLTGLKENCNGLLFCVGDGNHSLATAKTCYENNPTENSRYALVEFVNIHDTALEFEPIYRVLFNIDAEAFIEDFTKNFGGIYEGDDAQEFTFIYNGNKKSVSIKGTAKLCVATLQPYLDNYLKKNAQISIDYIHGVSSVKKLTNSDNTLGIVFSGMEKSDLFPALIQDGSLPRKTFSMGHADDKRFYLEARYIK